MQVKQRKRMNQVKNLVGQRAHLEIAKGTPEQSRVYCSKEEGRLEDTVEFGEMLGKGKRTDLEAFVQDMKEKPLSDAELLEKHPNVLAKYPRFVSTTRRVLSEAQIQDEPLNPRPGWQESCSRLLTNAPDTRKVHWYYDEVGNAGKSYFARRYRCVGGDRPYVITGGKHADILYAYARQPVIFFDWPRSGEEAFPYGVVEAFKNGYFLNTKYESVPVYFNTPHVVVFANFQPDRTKLSEDRWDVHNIRNFI